MKKLLALILAAALALSLVACGGGGAGDNNTPNTGSDDTTSTDTPSDGMTKEEMLEQATECDAAEIAGETANNVARATQTYCGKILSIKGTIGEISADHIQIESNSIVRFKVYLPVEDIVNLENGQLVTIVGNTGAEITEEPLAPGIPQNIYVYEVNPAYFVTDIYEYTGTPRDKNDSFPGAWNVEFSEGGNLSYLRLVYFDSSVDVSQYQGKEITFSAKNVGGYKGHYYDAIIVE